MKITDKNIAIHFGLSDRAISAYRNGSEEKRRLYRAMRYGLEAHQAALAAPIDLVEVVEVGGIRFNAYYCVFEGSIDIERIEPEPTAPIDVISQEWVNRLFITIEDWIVSKEGTLLEQITEKLQAIEKAKKYDSYEE
jgi:hypothetical protein